MDETFNDKMRQTWNNLNAEIKNRIRLFVFCVGFIAFCYLIKAPYMSGLKEHIYYLVHSILYLCFIASAINGVSIIWTLLKKEFSEITKFTIAIFIIFP